MTPIHWLALCVPFCACALLDIISTRWGRRAAWVMIVLCLAYLSVKS